MHQKSFIQIPIKYAKTASLLEIILISLAILIIPKSCKAVSNTGNEVIEVSIKPQIVKHEVVDEPRVVKLKCNILKNSFNKNRIMSVNELRWERKSCGYGLHLTNCGNYQTIPWTSVMCKNGSKFCDGYTLKLENPTSSDSGYYRCLYKNYMSRQFKVYKVFYLDVYDSQESFELLEEPTQYDTQNVSVNASVTFRCRARSLSPLYMIWAKKSNSDYKGDRQVHYGTHTYELLNSNGAYNIGNDLYISKLTIPRCQIPDSGQYYCIVISVNNANLLKNKTVSLVVMPINRSHAQTMQINGILQLLLWTNLLLLFIM